MPTAAMVGLHAQHPGDCCGRTFNKTDEGGHDTRDHGQDRSDNYREGTGLLDSKILRHHLADDHMTVGHHQEGEGKTEGVQNRSSCGRQQRMEQHHEDLEQRIFTGPAKAKTRQSHPNLSHGKQLLRSLQQGQSHPGGGMPLIGEVTKLRFPNRKQSNFRRSKEGVGQKDQAKQSESGNMAGARHYELKV